VRRDLGFTEILELGCTPDEIFWYLISPETASTVDPTIVEWRSEVFPPKVGTLNHLKAKAFGVSMRMTSRFTEFDPPRRMVVEGVRPPMAKWTRSIHDLQAVPGGMRYTNTVDMRPPFGFRLVHRLMARHLRRGVREGSERLLARFGPRKVPA
jgi:hypothetical protein